MFKKPKRNFRERKADSDSDEESTGGRSAKSKNGSKENGVSLPVTVTPVGVLSNVAGASGAGNAGVTGIPVGQPVLEKKTTTAITATKIINKPKSGISKVPSSNSVLSFDEDADAEVFQIKKPNHSKRLVRHLKKESEKEKKKDNLYSSSENHKPVSGGVNGVDQSKVLREVIDSSGDDSDERRNEDDEEEGQGGGGATGPNMQELLKSGQIPDASLIHLVRKRRALAREQGDDVIPLDATVKYEKKSSSSRLIRDDDNDRSDDDDSDEILAMSVRHKDLERRKIEEKILQAEEESHSDASDHERDWEEQQLRKGVSIPAQPPVFPDNSTSLQDSYYYGGGGVVGGNYQNTFVYGAGAPIAQMFQTTVASYLPSSDMSLMAASSAPRILPKDNQVIGIDVVKSRLVERLSEMTTVHRAHSLECEDIAQRKDLSAQAILKHRSETGRLEKEYRFFQEMRGFVRDYIECMNEKMGSISFIERCIQQLYQSRAEQLIKRRQDDIKDQALEYTPGKAVAVVTSESEDIARSRRRADREARRARRKRAREALGVTDHNNGWSTDDEDSSPSEAKKFVAEKERLSADVQTIFDDVVDEFVRYAPIMSRFEMWRCEFSSTYNEAYIALCLPKLFSPLLKVELITWNPLEPSCLNFEDSTWFNALMFYGEIPDPHDNTDDKSSIVVKQEVDAEDVKPPKTTTKGDGGGENSDLDLKLVPSIIEKLVVPKLTSIVETMWDPLSLQQTQRIARLIKHFINEYPSVNAESKNTQILIKAVMTRINRSLNDDIFIPLYPKHVLENRSSDAAVFFHRQFWSTIKFLGCVIEWEGIISPRHLKSLALDSLLNRYIIIALQNSPVNSDLIAKCQTITSLFPRDWFLACESDNISLPQLESLCRFLVATAKQLKSSSHINHEQKDIVRQICKMLVNIHATNHALSLS